MAVGVPAGRLRKQKERKLLRVDSRSSWSYMLDLTKSVGDCSPQELVAALMLKAAFNRFDPKQVLSDLYAHQEWWKSFVMGPPLPEAVEYSLDQILLTLRV